MSDSSTPRALSRVNPNPRMKKIKEKGMLLAITVVGLFLIYCLTPTSKAAKKLIAPEMPALTQESSDTLAHNLALIEQMKQAQAEKAHVTPEPRPEPVRRIKKKRISEEMLARINAPTTLISNSRPTVTASGEVVNKNTGLVNNNADSQFANQNHAIATVMAHTLAHPDFTVPAGDMIAATLQGALNSELPGMVAAVVERDIYSLTGEHVLIPRGSRLVGQYNANVTQGQSRFFVIWQRVQLPNGVVASIASPGGDSLGRGGVGADTVDRHFVERFGMSSLLSIIGAFAANQGVDSQTQFNSASQYRAAVAASFNQSAQQAFDQDGQIKPTLAKYQGAAITVFVAKDVDFSAVAKRPMPQGRLVIKGESWK